MNIKVEDLEDVIDREYAFDDIISITSYGIELKDAMILFSDSMTEYLVRGERGIGDRKYVGDRNCLTEPAYMKFTINGDVLIILFPIKDDFYKFADKIRELGFETFDLS